MAHFPLKQKWTKSPNQPVGVDWSNPLTRGLEHLYLALPTGMYDLVTGKHISNPASTSISAATTKGIMRDYDGVNLGYDAISSKDRRTLTVGMTGVVDAHSASATMLGLGNSSNVVPIIYTFSTTTASSSTLTTRCRNDGSSTSDTVSASMSEGDIFTHTIVRGDTTHKIKLNNSAIVTGETGTTGDMTIDRIAFCGLQRTSPALPADGKAGFVWLYDRALSDTELSTLHKNPYQLLKPRTQFIDISAAASGAYTLTADSASYTETGTDAGLRSGRKLAADTSSYSFTGQGVNLSVGHKLACESGNYSLTGSNSGLKVDRNLVADSTTYTYTGQDATLTYTANGAYTLTAETATYSFNGQDATLIAPTQGGGIRTRKVYEKLPVIEEDDWFEEDIKKALKPRKKLKLHKVDYIDVANEIASIEAVIENDKRNALIAKRKKRNKAIELLLLN